MNTPERQFLNVVHGKKNPKTDKVHWHIVGTLMITDSDKMAIHLDSLPIGDPSWNGWLNVYPRTERNQEAPDDGDGDHAEIPF